MSIIRSIIRNDGASSGYLTVTPLGAGIDARSMLQSAINSSDVVYVRAGNYSLIAASSTSVSASPYKTTVQAHLTVPSNKTIIFEQGANLILNNNNASSDNPSAIIINNAENVKIIGGDFAVSTAINNRNLYTGTPVIVASCNNVDIIGITCNLTRAGVYVFNSTNTVIKESIHHMDPNANGSTTSFGLYASSYCDILDCQSYQGGSDGNIGVFGSVSDGCVIANCRVYNWNEGQTAANIVKTGAQGIFVDSGPKNTVIRNNFVEGFYYGIDVKTNIIGTEVINNFVRGCKFGIAMRVGEANSPILDTKVIGNTVVFGPSSQVASGNTLPSLYLEAAYNQSGIYVSGTLSNTTITNNTIRASAGVTVDYAVGVYVVETQTSVTLNSSNLIANNSFIRYSQLGAEISRFNGACIHVRGVEDIVNSIRIDSNVFKVPDTAYSGTNRFGAIDVVDTNSISITNNSFEKFGYHWIINALRCNRLIVSGNSSQRVYGLLKADTCDGIVLNGNMLEATQEFGTFCSLISCTKTSVVGNIQHLTTGNSGSFVVETGTSNTTVVVGNVTSGRPITLIGGASVQANNI